MPITYVPRVFGGTIISITDAFPSAIVMSRTDGIINAQRAQGILNVRRVTSTVTIKRV